MRTRGVKIGDPVVAADQLDWMLLSSSECPNDGAEQRVIAAHFRRPHEPWGGDRAFVLPVVALLLAYLAFHLLIAGLFGELVVRTEPTQRVEPLVNRYEITPQSSK